MRKSTHVHCGKEEFRGRAEEAHYWILPGRAEQFLGEVFSTTIPIEPRDSRALSYQLDFLKTEIEIVNGLIDRMDGTAQTTKNWAIVTWSGAVGLALREEQLRPFIVLTALLPILFWYIDAVWRHLQRRSTYRLIKIRDFLNGEELLQSLELGRLEGFLVLDPVGRQYRGTPEYERHVSLWRTLRFPEVAVFYAVPALVSVILGILALGYRI